MVKKITFRASTLGEAQTVAAKHAADMAFQGHARMISLVRKGPTGYEATYSVSPTQKATSDQGGK